jgi:hypothetical protein
MKSEAALSHLTELLNQTLARELQDSVRYMLEHSI